MESIEVLSEIAHWKSRGVTYLRGPWSLISTHIPKFELGSFQSEGAPIENPFYRAVYRLPLTQLEHRVPVGIVSNTYTLAQHQDVAQYCLDGLRDCGIKTRSFLCELGLSTLGEWMHFRVMLPDEFALQPGDHHPLLLRLECFNSVEGGCSLDLQFSWLRLVCKNGLVIRESVRQMREVHNAHLDVTAIRGLVQEAFLSVVTDRKRVMSWVSIRVSDDAITTWVDGPLSSAWGKLAAFRVFHICCTGRDAEYLDPFEPELPSKKTVRLLDPVPGAPERALSLYDVSQALSWVASHRRNADERSQMLSAIRDRLRQLDRTI
jgi:hypothetical protein